MILLDANLLIYAVNQDLPQHEKAHSWLEQVMSGSATVGLPWVVMLAFLRITTSPRVFEAPLSVEQACDYVDGWLAQPVVSMVVPGERHWPILQGLLREVGTAANLSTDAHLAALALEHGYTIYSTDNDFKRFAGVRHVNPLSLGDAFN